MWPRMVASKWLRLRFGRAEKFNCDAKDEDESFKRSHLMRGQSEGLWSNCPVNDNEDYRIFVGTWNVGGRRAQDDLDLEVEDWLNSRPEAESADIYVIGFQEIVPLKAGKVFGTEDSRAAEKWDALIRKTLNRNNATGIVRSASAPPSEFASAFMQPEKEEEAEPVWPWSRERYQRVASKQMVGILITIWVKSEVRRNIRDVKVSCVGCGIMGCLGNKGSISVSLRLHQTSFCFVCTHLASGQKEGDEIRRNSDIAEILKRSHFPRDSAFLPQTIMAHDQIIWFGDLNYRLTLSDSKAMSLIHKNDWETLQQSDQLKIEQNAGRIFDGWEEGHLDFAPTYKYTANSDQYCAIQNKPGEKRRIPAWCDRILWYGKGLKQVSYERGEINFSDHRPVSAIFTTQIKSINNTKLKKNMGLPFNRVMEAEDLLSAEMQMLKATYQPEVCNGLISMKPENMQLDLLPVLTNMEARSSLNIESMLTQKPYDWENEYDFKAKSPGISQEQVVV